MNMQTNRRSSRRWNEYQTQAGELRWSAGRQKVVIKDQSCEGLGLESPANHKLKQGDHVWLWTASGVTEGLVTHLETTEQGAHIGLTRVNDYAPDELPKWRWQLGLGPRLALGEWRHDPAGFSPLVWGGFALFLLAVGFYLSHREPAAWNRMLETVRGVATAKNS